MSVLPTVSTLQGPTPHNTHLSTFGIPEARFDWIHIDLVGTFPYPATFSQSSTVLLIGQRPLTSWPRPLLTTSSVDGSPGLVCHLPSQPTVVVSSSCSFGRSSCRFWSLFVSESHPIYHPIANGLIERFHRQLKASLKAQPNPTRWTDALPLVMLGIRTALKAEMGCTSAELVYGTTLWFPGEFFDSSPYAVPDPVSHITQLKDAMRKLRAHPPHEQQPRKTHISNALSCCMHVFIRHDATCKLFQQPYDGTYRILNCTSKHFTVDISGRKDVVSLDCLKPAHFEISPSPTPPSHSHLLHSCCFNIHRPHRLPP